MQADAYEACFGVLLEVAKCRLGAAFVDEAAFDSEWPQESAGRLGQAMESEGCARRGRMRHRVGYIESETHDRVSERARARERERERERGRCHLGRLIA